MVKFFQNIRYKLLTENRFTRYLFYALGEIFLVVIGILIALNVNNRNLQRMETKKEEGLIEKLSTQTSVNLKKIEEEIKFYNYVQTKSDSILSVFKSKNFNITQEDVTALLQALTFDYHLNLDMTTLNEASENGNLSLIRNSELREAIYDFENQNTLFIQRENIINQDLQNHFMPYLYNNYNFGHYFPGYEYLISKTSEKSIATITDSLFFKNYIVIRKLYLEELFGNIEDIKTRLIHLQTLLNGEKKKFAE